MPGFWMIHSTVTDPEAFSAYSEIASPVVAKHGGNFIAFGGRHETREGEDVPRNVIIQFPSYEAALACYDDPDYQASLGHAEKAMTRNLVIVDSEKRG